MKDKRRARELGSSLDGALQQARDQVINLPPHKRHGAILGVDMLDLTLRYMTTKGEQGGGEAFTEAALDVVAAMGSTISSIALTISQGDRERAGAFARAWIRLLALPVDKMEKGDMEGAIEVTGA